MAAVRLLNGKFILKMAICALTKRVVFDGVRLDLEKTRRRLNAVRGVVHAKAHDPTILT